MHVDLRGLCLFPLEKLLTQTACLLVVRCIRYHKAKAPVKMSLTELARLTGQEAVELSPKARFSED